DVRMTFGKWRQQLRLMQAMRLLAEGARVTHAAVETGYCAPSAFISMFRKTLAQLSHFASFQQAKLLKFC
ncbi:MAG TPA: helix-turn-helix domain-containing protein, partial [Candidatus Sulfotelmatobacter sp.]